MLCLPAVHLNILKSLFPSKTQQYLLRILYILACFTFSLKTLLIPHMCMGSIHIWASMDLCLAIYMILLRIDNCFSKPSPKVLPATQPCFLSYQVDNTFTWNRSLIVYSIISLAGQKSWSWVWTTLIYVIYTMEVVSSCPVSSWLRTPGKAPL